MSRGLNKVQLIGHVGFKKVHKTKAGDTVVKLSVATNEVWKDKETGEKQQLTEWHNCVFFRRIAEIADQYLNKGSHIYLEGKLKTTKYSGDDGVERYSTEIIVNDMQMLSSKSSDTKGPPVESYDERSMPQTRHDNEPEFDDDIPF